MQLKIFLPLFIILSLPLVFQSPPTETLKLKVYDTFVQTPDPSGFFTILNIKEEDVDRLGGWPFPRDVLAQIHVELLQAGAMGVGWVIAFPQPDRLGGDEVFANALEYGGSVIALFEKPNGVYPPTTGTVLLGEDIGGMMSTGVVPNIEILSMSAAQGLATAPVEVDQLVRRIPMLLRTPDGFTPAFGTEVLKQLAGNSTYIIKTNPAGFEEITVQGLPPVPVDNLGRKWVSWIDTPQTTLSAMDVSNKFVFVGVEAAGIMPQLATPVGLLEPHKIQAALAESILVPNSPRIPDFALAIEILLFAIFVPLIWVVINYLSVVKGFGLATILLATTGIFGAYNISRGFLIDISWTLVSEFVSGSAAAYLNYQKQHKLRQQIKKQFEHYLDPRQVAILQKSPDKLKLGGERKYCTLLFTDVRGFTAMSERLEPEEVTKIMNAALTIQATAVKKYGGMVDKYIGDAMMAIFNAPLDLANHEAVAVLCAQEIQENIKNADLGVEIGVGINSGQVLLGNCGSDDRFDYTAIGDAVNLAARLESATKEVGQDILIGENTKKGVDFELELLTPIKVKGKKKKINLYTIAYV